MFWFFGQEADGILFTWPGVEPTPPALEGKALFTEPAGKSLGVHFLKGWAHIIEIQLGQLGERDASRTDGGLSGPKPCGTEQQQKALWDGQDDRQYHDAMGHKDDLEQVECEGLWGSQVEMRNRQLSGKAWSSGGRGAEHRNLRACFTEGGSWNQGSI